MNDFFRILGEYKVAFASGVGVTLSLAGIVWVVGLTCGCVVGWIGHAAPNIAGKALGLSSFLTTSIPVLVVLFWAHYPLQSLLGVVIDPFITAAAVLSLVNVFYVGTVVMNALDQFPRQFITAATVCGLSRRDISRFILAPLIIRQVTPALLSAQVIMLQSTLFASMISVNEILTVAQRVNAMEYKPIPIYSALALFFIILCVPLNGLAVILRRRFGRDFSER